MNNARFCRIISCLCLALCLLAAGAEGLEGVSITITAVGDCTLGGLAFHPDSGQVQFEKYAEKYGYDYYLENVRALFETDDFTVVNLEGPLTRANDAKAGGKFILRGSPENVQILTGSSVEVCNVANNHAFDFRQAGFDETIETLRAADLGFCGYDIIHYAECKGAIVGFVGFTEWDCTTEEMVAITQEARAKCDLLIASYHGGVELTHEMTVQERINCQAIVDAGADLVIGNHSHVYGPIERYKGKYMIASLGNFCFGANSRPKEFTCTIFQQTFTFDADGNVVDVGINIIPALISTEKSTNNCQPVMMQPGFTASNHISTLLWLGNFKINDVKWMENSFEVVNGLV